MVRILLLLFPITVYAANFYVSKTGTDTGSCTSSSPCLTIQYATEQALTTSATENTIHIGTGGWNESVYVTGAPPDSGKTGTDAPTLLFEGNGASNTYWNGNTTTCGTLIANYGSDVGIEDMTIEAEGDKCQSTLYAQLGGMIQVYGGVDFGPAWQQQLHAEGTGSQIELWDSFTLSGGINIFAAAMSNALIEFNPTGITVTINNDPNFSTFFSAATNGTVYIGHGTSFSGSMSGTKYNASTNGVIFTDGAGCGSIPGSGGSISSGGQCQ